MEVKVVLENELLSKLDNVAMRLHPGNSFEFRVKIAKNGNYLITMNRNQGDRSGYLFFAQGEHSLFNTACGELVKSVLKMIEERKSDLLQKQKAYLEACTDECDKLAAASDQVSELIS